MILFLCLHFIAYADPRFVTESESQEITVSLNADVEFCRPLLYRKYRFIYIYNKYIVAIIPWY